MTLREPLLLLVASCLLVRWGMSSAPVPTETPSPVALPANASPPARLPFAHNVPDPKWLPAPKPAMPTLEPPTIGIIRENCDEWPQPVISGSPRPRPRVIAVDGLRSGMPLPAYLPAGTSVGAYHGRVGSVEGSILSFDGQVVLQAGDTKQAAIQALGRCQSLPGEEDLHDLEATMSVRIRQGVVHNIWIGRHTASPD